LIARGLLQRGLIHRDRRGEVRQRLDQIAVNASTGIGDWLQRRRALVEIVLLGGQALLLLFQRGRRRRCRRFLLRIGRALGTEDVGDARAELPAAMSPVIGSGIERLQSSPYRR
jgi:hypothetical protein